MSPSETVEGSRPGSGLVELLTPHAELHLREVQDVALAQPCLADALAVHEGAVLAAEVPDPQLAAAQLDVGVLLRDRLGGEVQRETVEPADAERERVDREAPQLASALDQALQVEADHSRARVSSFPSGPRRVDPARRAPDGARPGARCCTPGPLALPTRASFSPWSCAASTPRPAARSERWQRRAKVRLPDGREVERSLAYRDDAAFVAAAGQLMASRARDDAPLGAWLLGGVVATRRAEAEPQLARALASPDERVAFEAAHALGKDGSAASLGALSAAARASPSQSSRRRPAGRRWRSRAATARPSWGQVLNCRREAPLAPGFRRGVSWWMSESRQDHGAASFRRLASLGVTWVSLHTWDPLQRGLDEPALRRAREAATASATSRRSSRAPTRPGCA